ncbi:hypothetical protein BDY19DRAFT_991109 [Irpex rosettiformis]|uniref:Uncharacterized protein n=1 Tax=Irpex rosettiformis TaxID=378272 RepID=A0ACB8UBD9_9APHY|nr:hypothetical protein BDY19DRAFT_991109 [Irpex rosettiformis]
MADSDHPVETFFVPLPANFRSSNGFTMEFRADELVSNARRSMPFSFMFGTQTLSLNIHESAKVVFSMPSTQAPFVMADLYKLDPGDKDTADADRNKTALSGLESSIHQCGSSRLDTAEQALEHTDQLAAEQALEHTDQLAAEHEVEHEAERTVKQRDEAEAEQALDQDIEYAVDSAVEQEDSSSYFYPEHQVESWEDHPGLYFLRHPNGTQSSQDSEYGFQIKEGNSIVNDRMDTEDPEKENVGRVTCDATKDEDDGASSFYEENAPSFFPMLEHDFDPTLARSWVILSYEIQKWLATLSGDKLHPLQQWGIELFWMSYIAAFPDFPDGDMWVSWDPAVVPFRGIFLTSWLQKLDNKLDKEDPELTTLMNREELWREVMQHIPQYFAQSL